MIRTNRFAETLLLTAVIAFAASTSRAVPILWDLCGDSGIGNIATNSVQPYVDAGVVEDLTGATLLYTPGASGTFTQSAGGLTLSVIRGGGGVTAFATKFSNPMLNDYIWTSGGSNYVIISGLSAALLPNTTYFIYLFGAGDNAGQGTVFTHNGLSIATPEDAPPALANGRFAKFGITNGAVVADTFEFGTTPNSGGFQAFNGFAIVQEGSTPPIVVSTTPTDLATGLWMMPRVEAQIQDGNGSVVSAATMKLFQNGVPVASMGTKAGNITTINYTNTTPLPAGATITNTVTYGDGVSQNWTNTWTWTVYDYQTIPTNYALATAATTPGFSINLFQTDSSGPAATPAISMAEQQFAGGLWTGFGPWDVPLPNSASPASGSRALINNEVTGADAGGESFSSTTAPAGTYINDLFVGIPGGSFSYLNFTYEVSAYLRLSPGNYRMLVNSDDGFKVSVAPGLMNPDGLQLGGFLSGVKGPSDVPVDFVITAAGDYPFRLLFYQASGGGALEWMIQNMTSGEKVLINDTSNPGAVLAFQAGNPRATLTKMLPANGFSGVPEQTVVEFQIKDGRTARTGIPTLLIDNVAVTPAVTSGGGTTTVLWTNTTGFAYASTHTAKLVWQENTVPATFWTNSTTFTVRNFTAADLPPGTRWFEVEDWDYSNGLYNVAADGPYYAGGAYQQADPFGANDGSPYTPTLNVDYFNDGSTGGDYSYRGNYGASKIGLEGRPSDTFARGNFEAVSANWNVGWNWTTDWCNYTRQLSNGVYTAYASIAGPSTTAYTASGLSIVRSGVGTTNQTLQYVGDFASLGTGGWQTYRLVPIRDADGNPAAIYVNGPVGSNTMTLRYHMRMPGSQGINNDWVALVPTTNLAPVILTASPADGATGVSTNVMLQFTVQAYDRPVNNAAVTLTLNGGSVAPVVTGPDANGLLSISYNPNGLVAGSSNTYVLSVPDTGVPAPVVTRTRTATFTVAAPPQPAATNITWSVTGGNQTVMEWPNGQGWRLEVQTNGLGIGLSTNWATVPGAVSPYTNTVNPSDPTVFYRLVFP